MVLYSISPGSAVRKKSLLTSSYLGKILGTLVLTPWFLSLCSLILLVCSFMLSKLCWSSMSLLTCIYMRFFFWLIEPPSPRVKTISPSIAYPPSFYLLSYSIKGSSSTRSANGFFLALISGLKWQVTRNLKSMLGMIVR